MYADFNIIVTIILIVAVLAVIPLVGAYLVLLERKIAAWTQDRLGPNRVGPWGFLQPIADGVKFIFKEQFIPDRVDRLFFLAAPGIALTMGLMAFAVVPFGRTSAPPTYNPWPQTVEEQEKRDADPEYQRQLADYNRAGQGEFTAVQWVIAPHVEVGLVYVFAIGSLSVYAVVLGGWSSNNKYSFLGGLRSSAQLISYEIPMGMAVLGVFYVTGSLNLERIIEYQDHHGWNVLFQPVAALLFLVSVFAECSRLPFDLPETEQELVGGYHTEYTGMKLLLFLLAEYLHMITTSFLVAILFFGGWELPWLVTPGPDTAGTVILKLVVLVVKMLVVICFYMFVRWTVPRFRFDQLMGLAWKVLMPLALVNVVAVLIIRQLRPLGDYSDWLITVVTLASLIAVAAYGATVPRPPTRIRTPNRGHGSEQLTLAGDHAVSPGP